MNEREAKRKNLWAHTLGPLNAPIQSEAACEVWESKSDSETSIAASDWIGAFKGPNVCTQSFLRFASSPHARSRERKSLSSRVQGPPLPWQKAQVTGMFGFLLTPLHRGICHIFKTPPRKTGSGPNQSYLCARGCVDLCHCSSYMVLIAFFAFKTEHQVQTLQASLHLKQLAVGLENQNPSGYGQAKLEF